MTLSHDKKLLASCTLDDAVKIIDVSNLEGAIKDPQFNEEEYELNILSTLTENHANHGKRVGGEENKTHSKDEKWEDMSDDESDSDDSDSSDEKINSKSTKKNKKLNPKNATLGATKKMLED